ncbi:MAG TPA: outer membrane protein assembly factor BamA [Verrucomicrobiae bacterium]|nr:outer membrane protein assembly factor BamA [Verrucomicrobiae bacterium]
MVSLLGAAKTLAGEESAKSDSTGKGFTLFHAALNETTLEEKIDEVPAELQAGQDSTNGSQPFVERIEFDGNRRIRRDTLLARIFTRPGDPYNEENLRRDFMALWNTQFFEDVQLKVEDGDKPNGKVIIFEVKERPVIRRIKYEGIHSISESDILDRFKEKKVGLTVESQFDPTRIKKAEVVLKELLSEHGRQYATVTPEYERIASSNAVILTFKIDEGPKVKVGKISFTGNHAFSDRKLIRAMHNDRPYAIPLYFWNIPVMSKTYDHDKLIEDQEVGIRGIYQDNGYMKVSLPDPILENVDTEGWKYGVPLVGPRSTGKAVNITIPIEEGDKYTMGTLKIVSSDPDKALSLKVDALKSVFPLKPGDVFSAAKVRKAMEEYTKIYGQYGFIDFVPQPQMDFDEKAHRIDVTMQFDEGKQYYVRRIEFSGNTTTRDKVIRRELLIDEGQLFNKRLWEISILRLNQLNYFDKIEADKSAEIKRDTKAGTVDILLKLKEKGKQSIGLQGGVSGLAGGFIGLTYQTNNFLGLGETLTLSAQVGQYTQNIMLGFSEPYLFDRPIASGFTIFKSLYKFNQAEQAAVVTGQAVSVNPQYIQDYNQNSEGFTVYASYPLKKYAFTRVGLTYGLTHTDITTYNEASELLFTQLQYLSIAGPSALNGILSSAVTTTITQNTLNNPINATSGRSYFYSLSVAGLGGNVKTITNTGEFKYFHPINHRRNAVGVRFLASWITGYGGGEVPPFNRFYMGGENDLRGFDIRAISPVTYIPSVTNQAVTFTDNRRLGGSGYPTIGVFNVPVVAYTITFPGADLQGVTNLEYRIPIAGPVSMTLFNDVGTDGILNKNALKLDPTGVENINQQFPLVNQGQQLQIAPNTNFHIRDSVGIEFNINLPIVQAPFRIYWAYNPLRLHETIVAPYDKINLANLFAQCQSLGLLDPLHPNQCDPSVLYQVQPVLQNPGRLNYFEPASTFRFTVSRTF